MQNKIKSNIQNPKLPIIKTAHPVISKSANSEVAAARMEAVPGYGQVLSVRGEYKRTA